MYKTNFKGPSLRVPEFKKAKKFVRALKDHNKRVHACRRQRTLSRTIARQVLPGEAARAISVHRRLCWGDYRKRNCPFMIEAVRRAEKYAFSQNLLPHSALALCKRVNKDKS